jgi:hypothetical protein
MTLKTIRQRLVQDERGIALVMALGILTVTAIMVVTIVQYTSSNQRTAYFSKTRVTAFDAADAGMNNALSILNNPSKNSLLQVLPNCHDPNDSRASDPNPVVIEGYYGSSSNFTSKTGWNHNPYGNATVDWCGDLDKQNARWFLWSYGHVKNPTGPSASEVNRLLSSRVTVVPTLIQPLNNPAWNYIFANHTGAACDQTLNNNVGGASRMYVAGNLCIENNANLAPTSLIVRGNLDLSNNTSVGANTSLATRVETYVAGNCRYQKFSSAWVACSGNQDIRNIFSKLADGTTTEVNHNAPVIAAPIVDMATWYANALPGPAQGCSRSSGTVPTFDNNSVRDNSVATVFDLTPASSYSCRVGPGSSTTLTSAMTASQTTVSVASATGFPTTQFTLRIDDEQMLVTAGFGTTTWTVTRGYNSTAAAAHAVSQTAEWEDANTAGELSWNATTHTLTVKGTIFIDGSAKVGNATVNTYNGQATLYVSGTFLLNGSLCAGVSGGVCTFSAWDPNHEMFTIVANGTGGQVNAGDSIQIVNNFSFQGGLFATGNVEYGNNAYSDGPIVGSQIILSNNVTTNSFPTITEVPAGMPGNPAVYAQPNPPQSFSG